MGKQRSIDTLTIDGGTLCFNFINTVYAWRGKNRHEYLPDYDEFLKWCTRLEVFPEQILNGIRTRVAAHPDEGVRAMETIWQTRQRLYRFFSALAAGHTEEVRRLLPDLNGMLGQALSQLGFDLDQEGLVLRYGAGSGDLLLPLRKVLGSAFDIIREQPVSRIKECPKCGWIFLDTTRNGRRRWCSPVSCGTTDKMNRYYKKKRETREPNE